MHTGQRVGVEVFALLACALRPQPSSVAAAESELPPPRVFLLTLGPGEHPFFKFGHNAIWIDPIGGASTVYNFGTFDFGTPALIPKFVMGRFQYWLSTAGLEQTLWHYQADNRSIDSQEMNLTPEQRRDLKRSLEVNALPENRSYLYDYFWDNCSTRVRDALDRA